MADDNREVPLSALPLRIRNKVEVQPNGCWHWKGWLHKSGYGLRETRGVRTFVHRDVHLLFIGPIDPGKEVDHTCHNDDPTCLGGWTCLHRRCCNPAHLEAITHIENVHRGQAATPGFKRGPVCPNGHDRTAENTRYRLRDGRLRMECRVCRREALKRKADAARAARESLSRGA